MLDKSAGNEPRTDADQSGTGSDFRGSFESHPPVYWNGELSGHAIDGKYVPLEQPKPVERVPYNQRRLRYRDREYEQGVACYFIGGEEGPIKIGYAENLEKRFKAIQSCSPVVLSVLAWTGGGIFAEMEYHERFASSRLHGEWFERTPELIQEIERLQSGSEIV